MLQTLSDGEKMLLVRLSDPEFHGADQCRLELASTKNLLVAAELHGVLPILWRNLNKFVMPECLAHAELRETIQKLEYGLFASTAQCLFLNRCARDVGDSLAQEGISFAIVKGQVFATLLYKTITDRPFTDVDFLIETADLPHANALIAARGYSLVQKEFWDRSSVYQEYKWVKQNNETILVEAHSNLVHYPALRRKRSLSYRDLVYFGDGNPSAPIALLVTAIVHASSGHKFHNLRLLMDILQAVRHMPAADDPAFLERVGQRGFGLDAAVALDILASLTGDARCKELAAKLGMGFPRRFARYLLRDENILNAPLDGKVSRIARNCYRLLQHIYQ